MPLNIDKLFSLVKPEKNVRKLELLKIFDQKSDYYIFASRAPSWCRTYENHQLTLVFLLWCSRLG